MRFLLATVFLVLPFSAPWAQTVRGAGARPCAEWSQARRGGGHNFEAEQWALGYLSALNAAAGPRQTSLFSVIDEKGAFAGMDSYCAAHPDEMLWNAIKATIGAHGA